MLSDSITVNHTVIPNRIVMPPMATAKSTAEGHVTDELIDYYCARAKAGTGLIVTEHAYISDLGKASPNQLSVSKDSDIEGLKKLADAVHACGNTKIIVQINHAGSAAKPDGDVQPAGPSPIPRPGRKDAVVPRELTKEEIAQITEEFAEAARRVKEAGFDGVEIHSAHGYLLNQFWSPLTNERDDEYGGGYENRTRIHREVLAAVRRKVGDDFMICVRLGGCDYMPGGNTIDEAAEAAYILQENGTDLLSLSGGMSGYIRKDTSEPGWFKDMSHKVRNLVHIPVILTGGITTKQQAEDLLLEKASEMIGVGRAMMEDPDWSAKALHKD